MALVEVMNMRITKTVSVTQGRYDAVERDIEGFNSTTREHGHFKTAEEHGCKPISCLQHWQHVDLPSKDVRVEVTFDEQEVAEALARIAARNSSGRAVEFGGLIKARVLK
jgi:hypothetical protein